MKRRLHKFILAIGLTGVLSCGLFGCNKTDSVQNTAVATTQAVTTESQSSETQANTEDKSNETAKNAKSDYVITLASNNSWESNGMVCAQFDGIIKNHTDATGKDWKVTVAVPDGSKLENSWNGNYNLNGTTLVITPVDYNKEVAAGGEVPFGFILDTPSAFKPDNVVLEIAGVSYALVDDTQNVAKEEVTTEEATKEAGTKEEATTETELEDKDTSGTPVANHGALSVKGTNVVDKNGKVFQLKGVSTHGINWFPDYVNKDAFSDMQSMGANAVRLAMYTVDYNGYCSGGNQAELESLIDKGVQACTDLGMYVIVDWHILNDNDPNQNKDQAKTFFEKMSKKYASHNNVIYEICNEPNGGTTWESIKSYAEEIIPIIRANDKEALIIVGTPNWSQDVDIASKNPITGQENILYAVHFYASTHKDNIRSKVETAIGNGLPVIVSESSICEASGNGSLNYDEGQKWMDLIAKHKLSCFAWSLGNKDETSSFIKSSVTKTSGFTKDDLTDAGKWYVEQYSK